MAAIGIFEAETTSLGTLFHAFLDVAVTGESFAAIAVFEAETAYLFAWFLTRFAGDVARKPMTAIDVFGAVTTGLGALFPRPFSFTLLEKFVAFEAIAASSALTRVTFLSACVLTSLAFFIT